MGIFQLAYTSTATGPLSRKQFADILEVSNRRNRQDDITGVLMYNNEQFFQVLEGGEPEVQACIERIKKDPRHTNISETWNWNVEHRAFSNWDMGYASAHEIAECSNGWFVRLDEIKRRQEESNDTNRMALLLAIQIHRRFFGNNGYRMA